MLQFHECHFLSMVYLIVLKGIFFSESQNWNGFALAALDLLIGDTDPSPVICTFIIYIYIYIFFFFVLH